MVAPCHIHCLLYSGGASPSYGRQHIPVVVATVTVALASQPMASSLQPMVGVLVAVGSPGEAEEWCRMFPLSLYGQYGAWDYIGPMAGLQHESKSSCKTARIRLHFPLPLSYTTQTRLFNLKADLYITEPMPLHRYITAMNTLSTVQYHPLSSSFLPFAI